jgi:4-nitrophenol 2-monooxygenase / 4-nitrocatechol 4-monooxygenase, reductase component
LSRAAIGRFATGVTAITCRHDGVAYGTTASAVSSLSDDPPMVLVCLHGASATGIAVAAAGTFAINVLAHKQAGLARRQAPKDPDKFEGIVARPGVTRAPLLDGVLAHLECRADQTAIAGTRTRYSSRT